MIAKRDIVIFDRSLIEVIGKEHANRVTTSLENLGKIYLNIEKSRALQQIFLNPRTRDCTIVILFHMQPGEGLRRKMFLLTEDMKPDFPKFVDSLYEAIGATNPNLSLDSIPVQSEAEFLKVIDIAKKIEQEIFPT